MDDVFLFCFFLRCVIFVASFVREGGPIVHFMLGHVGTI